MLLLSSAHFQNASMSITLKRFFFTTCHLTGSPYRISLSLV